ncbi:unnamed protein product [Nippostrongylus brasiliensis]|uniref:Collagen-like protein n=1 Tax=Nippostrongylus brasiliensis TaxID=27835 RepID=A0A0N4YKB3_NIPBR|nr:unnamed protein product [Nippostrongylus brasiliensis]
MIFIVATLIAATSCQLLINPLLLQGGGSQPGLGQGLVLPGGGIVVPANTAAAGPGGGLQSGVGQGLALPVLQPGGVVVPAGGGLQPGLGQSPALPGLQGGGVTVPANTLVAGQRSPNVGTVGGQGLQGLKGADINATMALVNRVLNEIVGATSTG